MSTWSGWARFLALVVVLGAVASLTPAPLHPTDADVYDQISREWFIRGCDQLHCSRVLVPWILGLFPGASMIKWKAAAVLCEAGAAWMMERWVSRLGAPPRAALQVMWMTALGSGSLYTLFDPHTADPLMHFAGPALMLLLFNSYLNVAILAAMVGILAKEFVAVPLMVAGLTWVQQRQWRDALRMGIGLVVVVALWAGWVFLLRVGYGNSFKNNSTDLIGGGYLFYWMSRLPLSVIVGSVVMSLGALWVLWPAGLPHGPRQLAQLTFAALPCILVWCYVQQPDRALWNFAFVAMPAAAVVLARSAPVVGWGVVAAHGILNLRFGAQLDFVPSAKYSLIVAMALALVAVWQSATMEQGRLSPGLISR
jgi:hypothetical protein